MNRLILASASPRRKKALEKLNIPFISAPNNLDESKEIRNLELKPEEIALYLSRKKAEAGASKFPSDFVLGMDTLVALDEKIIGKPKSEEDAIRMLWELNGRWHIIVTGVTLVNNREDYEENQIVKTAVKFFKHKKDDIKKYVSKGESLDKAGGYAIQAEGKNLAEKIEGDYSNVVGFPEKTVLEMLKKIDIFSDYTME